MRPSIALRRAFQFASIFTALILLPISFYLIGKKSAAEKAYFGQYLAPPNPAYDFKLTDQDGKPFSLSDLRGKVVVFAFGFTHCPNICPTTLASLAAFYKELPEKERNEVRVVFITLDPKRDTPEKLKGYVPFFNPTFIGLTGTEEQIARTAKEYGAFYETQMQTGNNADDFYTINHSSYVYVIDRNGNFSLLYHYEQLPDSKRIAGDIGKLLSASQAGKVN